MPLLFSQAKEILAQYNKRGGTCQTDPSLPIFVRKVLDYLLYSGSYGNLRTFTFCAQKGCITIPYELEVPLKVRIDGVVGSVWDKWFTYHQSKEMCGECFPCERALIEQPNYYPFVYNIPDGGARLATLGVCDEDPEAHIIFQGIDPTGREIVTTNHKGEQIVGEYVRIKKGQITYSQCTFAECTGVVKSVTKAYVQALWVLPGHNKKGFLADYSPLETSPAYRRFQVKIPQCQESSKVEVLGRIRLKPFYTDNDYIPFDNLYTLDLAGQAVNSNFNREPDLAVAANKQMVDQIDLQNEYKRVQNGQPIEFFLPLSGGSVRNIQ